MRTSRTLVRRRNPWPPAISRMPTSGCATRTTTHCTTCSTTSAGRFTCTPISTTPVVPAVTLLGPQRRPTLDRVVQSLGIDGPFAAVNAGWQDREADDGELLSLLGGRGVNLRLHARWMSVLHDDVEFARAEREHGVVLDEVQTLYRIRLEHALRATYEIAQRTDGHPRTRESALVDAIEMLRVTDERSEERRVGKECRSRWSPDH